MPALKWEAQNTLYFSPDLCFTSERSIFFLRGKNKIEHEFCGRLILLYFELWLNYIFNDSTLQHKILKKKKQATVQNSSSYPAYPLLTENIQVGYHREQISISSSNWTKNKLIIDTIKTSTLHSDPDFPKLREIWYRFCNHFTSTSGKKKKNTYFLHFYYSLVNTSVTSKASLYYVTAQAILSCSAFPIKSDKAIYFRGQIYLWCWILAN